MSVKKSIHKQRDRKALERSLLRALRTAWLPELSKFDQELVVKLYGLEKARRSL